MMTVKLIEPSGHEQIYAVKSIATERNLEYGPNAVKVYAWTYCDDEPLRFGSNGTLYVMNNAGQTIAKYWLGSGKTVAELERHGG
jgi:hypothetical protein